jgi:hypothetical protein
MIEADSDDCSDGVSHNCILGVSGSSTTLILLAADRLSGDDEMPIRTRGGDT